VRFFVTGGNGFIGSVVVRRLASAGHEVRCLLRASSDTSRIDGLRWDRAAGDVCDPASVRDAMRGCDATIHLAAPGGWDHDDQAAVLDVIEGGTRNVLSAAESHTGHRVLFVSSTAAIACSSAPVIFDENSKFDIPDESLTYAHAKHRAEIEAAAAFRRGVDVVTVNPGEVYGPGDTALGTAGNLIDFAKSTPVLVCDGGTSVVHVDDVASGILAAVAGGRAGERYILGGENVTIRALAELVIELTGRRTGVVRVPNGPVRVVARAAARLRIPVPFNPHVVPYATRYWFTSSDKARRELGVSFRGARETIADTLAWLVATGRLGARPASVRS
jgi:dihydroflavonol-4-reductase